MRLATTLLCAVLVAPLLPSNAAAQGPRGGYRVETAPLVLLAGGGASLGSDRTVVPGDLIMTTGIGIADVAHVEDAVTVTLANAPHSLDKGSLLVGAKLVGEPTAGTIYCDAPERLDKALRAQEQPGLGKRFRSTVQACFVDVDKDGAFESAFLAGALWPQESGMVAIPPIRYRSTTNYALPNSFFHVTFEKGAALQGPVLNIDAQILGRRVDLAFAKIGADRASMKKYPVERGVNRQYPFTVEIGDARIVLKAFRRDGRQLRLSVDKPFETRMLDFDLIDHTLYIYL